MLYPCNRLQRTTEVEPIGGACQGLTISKRLVKDDLRDICTLGIPSSLIIIAEGSDTHSTTAFLVFVTIERQSLIVITQHRIRNKTEVACLRIGVCDIILTFVIRDGTHQRSAAIEHRFG